MSPIVQDRVWDGAVPVIKHAVPSWESMLQVTPASAGSTQPNSPSTHNADPGRVRFQQLFDKMWQLPDIEDQPQRRPSGEGVGTSEPAPAQNITQHEAYEIAEDS